MKPLFITIDTEGDVLWDNPKEITTENVLWIPKFQELCEKYELIPTWLTDYEIINDDRYVEYIKEKNDKGMCEVGMHIHARNNPPVITLDNEIENGAAYLIEYPIEVMREKILYLKDYLEKRLQQQIITHRAGRWTINMDYIRIIAECGIKYDCSITPGLDWSSCEGITPRSGGSNYQKNSRERYIIFEDIANGTAIVEYPMTIVDCEKPICPSNITLLNLAKSAYSFAKKKKIWLRPNIDNLNEMKYALRLISDQEEEYAEFMIHSSELMPGGGPKHSSLGDIERMYQTIEDFFIYAKNLGYVGFTFDKWEKYRLRRGK